MNCSACCAWLVGSACGELMIERTRFCSIEGDERRWCEVMGEETEGWRIGSSRRMRRYMERMCGRVGVDIVIFGRDCISP
jgi:hypothetical protein